jgi:hypothetical protein
MNGEERETLTPNQGKARGLNCKNRPKHVNLCTQAKFFVKKKIEILVEAKPK